MELLTGALLRCISLILFRPTITYCYGIALNKQILYCRPKRTSGWSWSANQVPPKIPPLRFQCPMEALCFRLLSDGSLL